MKYVWTFQQCFSQTDLYFCDKGLLQYFKEYQFPFLYFQQIQFNLPHIIVGISVIQHVK
jgi:hypothetical protein